MKSVWANSFLLVVLAGFSFGAGLAYAVEQPAPHEGDVLIMVPPEYPPEAVRRGDASVDVAARVLPDGSLVDMRVSSEPPSADLEASVRSVAGYWRVHPKVGSECQMVEGEAHLKIWFEIADGKPKVSFSRVGERVPDPRVVEQVKNPMGRRLSEHEIPRYPERLARSRRGPTLSHQVAYIFVQDDGKTGGVHLAPMRYYRDFEEAVVSALGYWTFPAPERSFCAQVPVSFKLVP